jgi:UrcA family protein
MGAPGRKTMRKFTLTLAVIAAIAASPAAGQQAAADPVARVAIGDLDLASAAGQRMLARRIGQATERVCGSYLGTRHYYEVDAIDQCRRHARSEVRRQVAAIQQRQRIQSASR